MACELVTLSDERVKRFGDSVVYLICGKVISLETNAIDMSDLKDVAGMIEFADRLYKPESEIDPDYGDRSVCLLFDDAEGDLVVEIHSVDMLRDPEMRAMARRELGLSE